MHPTDRYRDLHDDTVDSILDVAGEVVLDHAPDPGNTRIERLARWVVSSVDATVTGTSVGGLGIYRTSRERVARAGTRIGIDLGDGRALREYTVVQARELAAALLRAAHDAEASA